MLFNFVDSANEVFGVFAGVAIGGETWVANGKEYKPSKGSEAYGNFQTILNVGVRGVLNERLWRAPVCVFWLWVWEYGKCVL